MNDNTSVEQISSITNIDVGELLLETIKRCEVVTPELQNLVVKFCNSLEAPKIKITYNQDE